MKYLLTIVKSSRLKIAKAADAPHYKQLTLCIDVYQLIVNFDARQNEDFVVRKGFEFSVV